MIDETNTPTYELIRVDTVIIDPAVQRPLDEHKLRKMFNTFSLSAVGTPCISHRHDNTNVAIDGQHRFEVMNRKGLGQMEIKCEVFRDLSLEQEATLFLLRNETSRVQKLDKFRVRITQRDPIALEIIQLMGHHGWSFPGHGPHPISAVDAIERLYKANPVVAALTLEVVTTAWGHVENAVDNRILAGIGTFLLRFHNQIVPMELASKLAVYPGGAKSLIGKARGYKETTGRSMAETVAEIVTDTYNFKKKSRRLPEWRAQ